MMDYSNLERVQEIIEKETPYRVYLRNGRPKDLADIIHRMMIAREVTYGKDKNDNEITQCDMNRRRSIEDVYLCMRSYKKTTTYTHVYNAVEKLYTDPKILSHNDCGQVLRRVHSPVSVKTTVEQIRERIGELNLKINAKPKTGRTVQAQARYVDKPKPKRKV